MNTSSISVCLATYNGETYIVEQITSIISQLNENDEIIISDDGSTDQTISLIEAFNDPRIRVVYNQGPHGYTSNFENALRHCNNEIIFLSDQDDIWVYNKVKNCLRFFDNYDFIVHDATVVSSNLEIISNSYHNTRGVYNGFWLNIYKFGYLGCCMAFKRDILEKALPFPSNHKLCTHDNWLFLIGAKFFRIKIIPDCLILYRRHQTNTSSGGKKMSLDLLHMLKYRLYIIYHIFFNVNFDNNSDI